MTGDLTSLATLKAYLGVTATTDDALLTRLVTAASGYVRRYTARDITLQAYSETRSGQGTNRIALRQYPVQSITSLTIDGLTIPQQPAPAGLQSQAWGWAGYAGVSGGWGWVLEPERILGVVGYRFSRGHGNIQVGYKAGFEWSEADTVPANPGPYTIQAGFTFTSDAGVSYTGGAALTAVASAPATGQYSVNGTGLYTFAAGDAGAAVTISYGYVPPEIEQACVEIAAWRYKEKDRIAHRSKNLQGEIITFNVSDVPASVQTMLSQFRRVAPV